MQYIYIYISNYWGPMEGACSLAVPAMSTRPKTSALRMPSTHPSNIYIKSNTNPTQQIFIQNYKNSP